MGDIGPEGHYRDRDKKLLGNIDETPPKLYLRVGRFDREYAGDVQSLRVRDGNELFQLREFVPKVPGTSAGRIK